jgi:hypothetical protein
VEALKARKQPLPSWYKECPPIHGFQGWFLKAFWHLQSEKGGGGMIPYSKIIEYVDRIGLPQSWYEPLAHIVWELDSALTDWGKSEAQRQHDLNRPSPSARAKTRTKKY